MRQPTLRQGATASWLNTATTSSTATLVTLYLQNTLGRSPLTAAATLLPFSLAVIIGAALAALGLRRLRRERVVVLGLSIVAVSIACIVAAADTSTAIGTVAFLVVGRQD